MSGKGGGGGGGGSGGHLPSDDAAKRRSQGPGQRGSLRPGSVSVGDGAGGAKGGGGGGVARGSGTSFMAGSGKAQRTSMMFNRPQSMMLNDGLKSVAVPASHLIPSEAEGRPKAELKYPSLDDLRWRVEVTISTSALSRVLKPSVLLEMTLSDGSIETFEVSHEKFHELRFNVARVLKEMEDMEKNPILKIK